MLDVSAEESGLREEGYTVFSKDVTDVDCVLLLKLMEVLSKELVKTLQ